MPAPYYQRRPVVVVSASFAIPGAVALMVVLAGYERADVIDVGAVVVPPVQLELANRTCRELGFDAPVGAAAGTGDGDSVLERTLQHAWPGTIELVLTSAPADAVMRRALAEGHALDRFAGVTILADVQWDPDRECWVSDDDAAADLLAMLQGPAWRDARQGRGVPVRVITPGVASEAAKLPRKVLERLASIEDPVAARLGPAATLAQAIAPVVAIEEGYFNATRRGDVDVIGYDEKIRVPRNRPALTRRMAELLDRGLGLR